MDSCVKCGNPVMLACNTENFFLHFQRMCSFPRSANPAILPNNYMFTIQCFKVLIGLFSLALNVYFIYSGIKQKKAC